MAKEKKKFRLGERKDKATKEGKREKQKNENAKEGRSPSEIPGCKVGDYRLQINEGNSGQKSVDLNTGCRTRFGWGSRGGGKQKLPGDKALTLDGLATTKKKQRKKRIRRANRLQSPEIVAHHRVLALAVPVQKEQANGGAKKVMPSARNRKPFADARGKMTLSIMYRGSFGTYGGESGLGQARQRPEGGRPKKSEALKSCEDIESTFDQLPFRRVEGT